jgi:hypothetical protein
MAEHDCKHEVDLALMGSNISEMKNDVERLISLIQGNGSDGLKGKIKSALVQLKIQWALMVLLVIAVIIKSFM